MIESGNFNIYNTAEPTNKDLVVVFSPGQNITTYAYNIYKDNIVIETNNITTNTPHTFYLTETGTYKIIVNTIDNTNKATQME